MLPNNSSGVPASDTGGRYGGFALIALRERIRRTQIGDDVIRSIEVDGRLVTYAVIVEMTMNSYSASGTGLPDCVGMGNFARRLKYWDRTTLILESKNPGKRSI